MARAALATGIKIAAWLVAGIALLIAIAAVALAIFFDANDYKPRIIALVKEKTGRDLAIPGDLEASVFPGAGVKFAALELSNAAGFGPQPFARIESGHLRIMLFPLLKRQIRIDSVSIHGLTLNLSRNKSGQSNWHDLKPKGERAEPSSEAFSIGAIALTDAKVSFDDQSSGELYVLDQLTINTDELSPNKDFDFELKSQVSSKQPELIGQIETSGAANIDPVDERYRFEGKLLKAELSGKDNVKIDIDGKLSAELRHSRYKLENLLATAEFAGEKIPEKLDVKLTARRARIEARTATLEGFVLQGLGITVDGNFQGNDSLTTGTLNVAEFNPRDVIQRLGMKPPQTTDPKVLNKASLGTELKASPKALDLKKLTIKLDESTLTGNIAIENFSKPAIIFALVIDKIDLDRYRIATTRAGSNQGAGEPSLDRLRGQNIRGTLRVGELKIVDERARDFLVTVDTRE